MTGLEWIIFIGIIQVIHFLGTWKLYEKAGRKAWEAAIPIYNAIVLMKIINRPKWWVILLFVPIVNLFMFPVIWVETIRSFGKNSFLDSLFVIITLGFYIYYVNYMLEVTYIEDRDLNPRTSAGEWVSSIVFAIVAATMVHTYFMQPYTIPTSSLEKSLLVGDFLFVSKFHYGARTPMTAVAAPMVHDTIPVLKTKSYLTHDGKKTYKNSLWNKLSLPYFRLPALQKIKRNDIVVFSWPTDTVDTFQNYPGQIFHYKNIDKKSNYVKRCVGIAGDSLQIIDGKIHIDGKPTVLPDRAKPQFFHKVTTNGKMLNSKMLKDRYHISEGSRNNNGNFKMYSDGSYYLNITEKNAKELEKHSNVKSVIKNIESKGTYSPRIFPHNEQYNWNQDNYGPIYIPEAGKTVAINSKTIPLYKRIIEEYEHNNLLVFNDEIYINGKLTTEYTFKQDYYWMMGDNRHNSQDARYWGFVPFDHVVGKPVFIWMSFDGGMFGGKPRWDRFFTTVHGNGEPTSYLWVLPLIIFAWFGYGFYKKKKAKA